MFAVLAVPSDVLGGVRLFSVQVSPHHLGDSHVGSGDRILRHNTQQDGEKVCSSRCRPPCLDCHFHPPHCGGPGGMSDTTAASIGHLLGQNLRIPPSLSHLPKMLQGERHPLDVCVCCVRRCVWFAIWWVECGRRQTLSVDALPHSTLTSCQGPCFLLTKCNTTVKITFWPSAR